MVPVHGYIPGTRTPANFNSVVAQLGPSLKGKECATRRGVGFGRRAHHPWPLDVGELRLLPINCSIIYGCRLGATNGLVSTARLFLVTHSSSLPKATRL